MLMTFPTNFDAVLYQAAEYLPTVLENLNLDFRQDGEYYYCKCPVHDSDQYKCSIFVRHGKPYWRCFTRECEKTHGKTLLSLIAAIRECSKGQAVKWLETTIGKSDISCKDVFKQQEILQWSNIPHEKSDEIILEDITEPSRNFNNRGLSLQLISRYGIYDSKTTQRTVVPIADIDKTIIGTTSRSLHNQCGSCGYFHQGMCPAFYSRSHEKWIFSKGFRAKNHLFNLDKAKRHIQKSRTAIITEGVIDCLKLVDAGYLNVVAIFGTDLSYQKRRLLLQSGAMNLMLLLDNDPAGQAAKDKILIEYSGIFNIECPIYIGKDIGELAVNQIRNIFSKD